jgi:glycine/D-amino acid oxidase-like deaminating enzyme
VRAGVVVRATEGYTASLEGHDRELVPLGNYMIATEPIPDDVWAGIGLARREVFEDSTLMLGYGNRTRDGRIAWGGMSAPSPYGTRVPPSPMTNGRVARRLRDRLIDLFPALEGIEVTHEWGGIMGVARDLRPGLGLDPATGLAWIGGYFGAGVAAANAAGHALADVISGTDSDRVRLPWVGHRSPRWEPAPVRWLGVHAATTAAHVVDRLDRTR